MTLITQKEFKSKYGGNVENLIKGESLKDNKLDVKMFATIKLILPYPPSLNRLYANSRKGRTLSAEGRQFKKDVATICLLEGVKPITGNLILRADYYRPRKIGDLDNVIKITQDSLEGIAYQNDRQIVEIHARRFDDKHRPRVEVIIEKAIGKL